MGRLNEIDAMKRNIAPVLTALERAAMDGDDDTAAFGAALDALVESRNVSLGQIASVGELIRAAFTAGLQSR